jgi:hypothetical protein
MPGAKKTTFKFKATMPALYVVDSVVLQSWKKTFLFSKRTRLLVALQLTIVELAAGFAS